MQKNYKFITATLLGNVVEWYDFSLYGYLAAVIAEQFFFANDVRLSLLLTLNPNIQFDDSKFRLPWFLYYSELVGPPGNSTRR